MKRRISGAIWLLAALCLAFSPAGAGPLVLDKGLRGPIYPDHLSLELRAAACDATQTLVPDGSKLVSDRFAFHVDDQQLGYFSGPVQIVAPDGRILFRGLLQGTAGLATGSTDADNTPPCLAPGHLDGQLSAAPDMVVPMVGPAGRNDLLSPPPVLLHFTADRIPQAETPLFEGRLKGLFAPPPPPPLAVTIMPDRLLYGPADPIVAIISNQSGQDIVAWDGRSDCTIVWLQKLVQDQWPNVEVCQLEKPSVPVTIKAGETVRVELPGGDPATGKGREPGVYRLSLDYQVLDAQGQPSGDALNAVSPAFKVGGLPPPPDGVTVTPERPQYQPTEPIVGLVTNRTVQPIASPPIRSYCTILLLQRQTPNGWAQEGTCNYFVEPDPVIIAPGQMLRVLLPPGSDAARHEPGVYRMLMTFRNLDASGQPAGEEFTAVSPTFSVMGMPGPFVKVAPSRGVFRPNERIVGLVVNGGPQPVQTHAFNSFCTILQLERQDASGWSLVGGCTLPGGPAVRIDPGQTLAVTMPPEPEPLPNLQPGFYRLTLKYQVLDSAGNPSGEALASVSPVFSVTDGTTPAHVDILPDRPAYGVSDTITAILRNGPVPVRVMDEQSLCTIVQLQRMTDTGWTLVSPCPLDRVPIPTDIPPGQVLQVPLTRNEPWVPGRYRLALTFTALGPDGSTTGAEQTTWSDPFAVGVTPPIPSLTMIPSQDTYETGQPIVAVLKNGPVRSRIFDMHSYCTIVELQRAEAGQWMPVAGCPLARMPIPVFLEPGQEMKVALPPSEINTSASWTAGMYRLVVAFAPVDPEGHELGPEQVVATQPFQVGSLAPPTGGVILAPDSPAYGLDGRIAVDIRNDTDRAIQAFEDGSFCTLVTLLKQDSAGETPVAGCPRMGLTPPVVLKPGEARRILLPPDTQAPAWEPGYYRLWLHYTPIDANGVLGQPVNLYSDRFPIGSPGIAVITSTSVPSGAYPR